MTPTLLTVAKMRAVHTAGGFKAAHVVATGATFYIAADFMRGGNAVLARKADATPRMFKYLATPLRMLRRMGFASASVDMAKWDTAQKALAMAPARPKTTR